MIVESAHFLEDEMRAQGHEDVEIRGRFFVSINGREAQLLIDPEVGLTGVLYPWFGHADKILPLQIPVRVVK